MYLHIGGDNMIKSEDVIGIFDIEAVTVSRDTKEYLNTAARKKREVSCTEDIPRSFVVTFDKDQLDERVYISRLSPKTLEKRIEDREVKEII